MAVTIPRAGTQWVGDPVTFTRGGVAEVISVATFHTLDATWKPAVVADLTHPGELVGTAAHPLWAGTPEVMTRIGARATALTLPPGDYQRWTVLVTGDEDIVEAVGTVTIS